MTTTADILKIRKPKPKYPIIKEIAERFSPRFFSEEKITQKEIDKIFEAARLTPSAYNNQPWLFYWAQKGDKIFDKLFSCLSSYNQGWAKTAPFLVLCCFTEESERGKNPYAVYDLGAAVISLILQAKAAGIYARQMALFDHGKVKKLFKLEKNYQPFIIVTLGKIGNYLQAPQEIIEKDSKKKVLKDKIALKLK